jgi:hypothetical protein
MDETDTGAVKSPEVLAAEAARMAAEQRRAVARAQFQTPTWLGPNRAEGTVDPQIPSQPEAEHDDLDDEPPLPPIVIPSNPIPHTAHWAEKARPRLFAGTVLLGSLAGVIGFLVATIITQSIGAIVGLATCAIVAVIFRGALMSADLTQVDLKGSVLRIRRGGVLDVVNLADPMHYVELVGTPDQPSWRLRFEAVDGRVVELGPRQVDPGEMHRIATYYRAIANRDRLERERRFNR